MTDVSLPMKRTCPFAPPPEYTTLLAESPISKTVLPLGNTAWVLTRHADIRAMLSDQRFSSDRRNPLFPLIVQEVRPFVPLKPSLLTLDQPEHGLARREVLSEFTVKRMREFQPTIQRIVDRCVDDMVAGEPQADVVTQLALPVPALVICELLGVPYADHDSFQGRTSALLDRTIDIEEKMAAVVELHRYLTELVTAKEAAPTEDDLIGRQIRKTRASGTYDREALVSLVFLLLVAGHESTANMTSLGVVYLLEHPEHIETLKADPAKTPAAVEELLRFFTIADLASVRVAVEDVEIGGTLIRAGEGVVGLSHAANHDPAEFAHPEVFDIARGGGRHVAFGYGAHQCIGASLARVELQVVFDTLFRRLPGLRLAKPFDELPWKHDAEVFGLHELPVTW